MAIREYFSMQEEEGTEKKTSVSSVEKVWGIQWEMRHDGEKSSDSVQFVGLIDEFHFE